MILRALLLNICVWKVIRKVRHMNCVAISSSTWFPIATAQNNKVGTW